MRKFCLALVFLLAACATPVKPTCETPIALLDADINAERATVTKPGPLRTVTAMVNSTPPVTDYRPDYAVIYHRPDLPIAVVILVADGCVLGGAQVRVHAIAPYLSATRWSV